MERKAEQGMNRAAFTSKCTVTEENGSCRFTFYCGICNAKHTTRAIRGDTVQRAFEQAQQEARQHFNRCHGCHVWVCDDHYNEDLMRCVKCAPRR